ncbi:ABC transporter substrate-binding protein [Propionivibrio sp.]|uniref:ABC transporter substrate-binding protein n=1 Tax=Propionivibrio sp. TaxID=2212460 RepID=UPI0025FC167F|nr:ABC transporter substrate-binding protein [Propionivibrio sp.]MBK7356704.1 ABC transporter substrate-binding protein [Propionivibrio sp.]MBK8744284.1 ABC transporter substrate-binding protein [Propionivibrio sp.]MBL0208442.1 ABC transporter substrate-binding protein [Propionivibrio sp.]
MFKLSSAIARLVDFLPCSLRRVVWRCWLVAGVVAVAWPLTSHARIEFGASSKTADATIGCMFPLAGRAAIYGRDSIAGMKLALADLKAAVPPGTAPRLRILVEDDRSKASVATRIATNFISRDKTRFLCGIVSSGVAQAVSRVALKHQVIMVGTDHASSRLTIEDFHRYYFRVSNDTYTSMAAGARYLAELQKKNGWRRLAFIGPDYDYGHIAWRDLESVLVTLGVRYEMVGHFWPRLYEPDYTAYIGELMAAKPDVVVTALWGGDFIAFLKQALSSGLMEKAKLANFDTGGNYDVLVSLEEQVPGSLILSARHHNNWPDTPRNHKFVDDFYRLEGRFPTYAAEGAYAGIMAIGRAMLLAGRQASTEQLIRTLEGLHMALPEDPDGYVSHIDPETHQIVQAQAIGEVVRNSAFPPAKVMLGHWVVYRAEDLQPNIDLVRIRRAKARGDIGNTKAIPTSTTTD